MNLDQYLVTVAWLWIAWMMLFAIRNCHYTILFLGDTELIKSIDENYKLKIDGFMFFYAVILPTVFFTSGSSLVAVFLHAYYIGG